MKTAENHMIQQQLRSEFLEYCLVNSSDEAVAECKKLNKYYERYALGGLCPLSGRGCDVSCLSFVPPTCRKELAEDFWIVFRAFCSNPLLKNEDNFPLTGKNPDLIDIELLDNLNDEPVEKIIAKMMESLTDFFEIEKQMDFSVFYEMFCDFLRQYSGFDGVVASRTALAKHMRELGFVLERKGGRLYLEKNR